MASPTRSAMQSANAKFYSRSNDVVIRVYDAAGNVIETHEHAGDFREVGSNQRGAAAAQAACYSAKSHQKPQDSGEPCGFC